MPNLQDIKVSYVQIGSVIEKTLLIKESFLNFMSSPIELGE